MKKSRFAKYTQLSAPPMKRMLTTERVKVLEKTLALIDSKLAGDTTPEKREYLLRKRRETEDMLNRAKAVVVKDESPRQKAGEENP